ncbi:MAG: VapC toxin family PIN domain ribonuclease [Acidobacteria bacterium 13_1_20CM_3_53_8]|nr:MAG: VapC toxin family PIN domain ribonuclease [Acidobacteria bacterium 13_1_20CM_3_53_8]
MRYFFADTSGWGNLINAREPFHARAAQLYRERRAQGYTVLTSSYILSELISLMTSPLRIPRATTINFIDSLKTSAYVEVVHVDETLDMAAWQLLKQRPDKLWSLVDCVSFVLMQQRGIDEALTTDHNFEQAGFTRLLK